MNIPKKIILFLLLILIAVFTMPAAKFSIPVASTKEGNPKKIFIGVNSVLGKPEEVIIGKDTSLNTLWITMNDNSLLVKITETIGVSVTYWSDSVKFRYSSSYELIPVEDLSAIEIRFLLFNVWGEHVKNLSATYVQDFTAGKPYFFENQKWSLPTSSEAEAYYASIAYVARVRTKSGKVISANNQYIIEEAQKFSSGFSESDLTKE